MRPDQGATEQIDPISGNLVSSEIKKYMVTYGLFPTQAATVLGSMTTEDREELISVLLGSVQR